MVAHSGDMLPFKRRASADNDLYASVANWR